jgi:L-asparaginase II
VIDPVLVEVTRGPLVESRHRGAIVVVDASGKRRAAVGDVEQAVFPRSAIKALQALPLVESGAADRYGFGPAELALACSSHNGEPRHVETAVRMLAAAGRGEDDLECGPQIPSSRAAADALVRAGFICFACHSGFALKGYVEPGHPVQREIASVLEEMTGAALGPEVRGIDGCSIPTWAIPLEKLALAFARLVTGEGLSPLRAAAARHLVDACADEPFMVAGSGRIETDALSIFGRRLFVKGGAEGVQCAAFPEIGLGVAIKCDDGAGRAAEVLVAAAIDALLPMSTGERARFADWLNPPILTRRGRKVGDVRPVAGLVAALRDGRPLS